MHALYDKHLFCFCFQDGIAAVTRRRFNTTAPVAGKQVSDHRHRRRRSPDRVIRRVKFTVTHRVYCNLPSNYNAIFIGILQLLITSRNVVIDDYVLYFAEGWHCLSSQDIFLEAQASARLSYLRSESTVQSPMHTQKRKN